jgi:hypothetical protein
MYRCHDIVVLKRLTNIKEFSKELNIYLVVNKDGKSLSIINGNSLSIHYRISSLVNHSYQKGRLLSYTAYNAIITPNQLHSQEKRSCYTVTNATINSLSFH